MSERAMNGIRTALALIGTSALGYALMAFFVLPWLNFGVAVSVCAGCVIGIELCRAIQRDRDKTRHPSQWQLREEQLDDNR